jgi:threonine/homoserine/homoserine lactone efflux protein
LRLFIDSLIIGVSIAAPVGPIGVLCIRRTLAHGRRIGLVSGLGAASADAIYGLIAAFGLTIVTNFLLDDRTSLWLRLIGGAFLVYLGVTTFRTRPPDASKGGPVEELSAWGAYASTLALTITNPATILAFTAIFAGLGFAERATDTSTASLMVAGVAIGSAMWWLLLSFGVSMIRRQVGPGLMLWINRVSGTVLTVFGLLAMVSVFR